MFPSFNLFVVELHKKSSMTDIDVDHTVIANGRRSVGLDTSNVLPLSFSDMFLLVVVLRLREGSMRGSRTRIKGRRVRERTGMTTLGTCLGAAVVTRVRGVRVVRKVSRRSWRRERYKGIPGSRVIVRSCRATSTAFRAIVTTRSIVGLLVLIRTDWRSGTGSIVRLLVMT